jgi:hypothetical protein
MANIIDGPQSSTDKTVQIFDNFYNFDLVVDGNQYEIVHSFFYNLTKSKNVTDNFTLMIFRISTLSGENPLSLVDYLQGKSKMEVNSILAYYLNSVKSKTSLYGVNSTPQPNYNTQRNIVV